MSPRAPPSPQPQAAPFAPTRPFRPAAPLLGSSQVNVMLSSESSGSEKALRMALVNSRYPWGPGFTSNEYCGGGTGVG